MIKKRRRKTKRKPMKPKYPGPLNIGSKGEHVKMVQRIVGATPDGDFGPATGKRVSAWRRRNGLGIGTKVGPKTWAKMFNQAPSQPVTVTVTTEPVKKLRVPKELRKYGNGKLPPHELIKITGGGTMWGPAGFWWNHMAAEAATAGITIKAVSEGYRSYALQRRLFLMRYSKKRTGRKPQVTRIWKMRRWYLRKGKSPSATPGTSPHGWGLAQDIEVPRATYNWMCKNAPRYGFYLQGKSKLKNGKPNPEFEAWHWQFCHV